MVRKPGAGHSTWGRVGPQRAVESIYMVSDRDWWIKGHAAMIEATTRAKENGEMGQHVGFSVTGSQGYDTRAHRPVADHA